MNFSHNFCTELFCFKGLDKKWETKSEGISDDKKDYTIECANQAVENEQHSTYVDVARSIKERFDKKFGGGDWCCIAHRVGELGFVCPLQNHFITLKFGDLEIHLFKSKVCFRANISKTNVYLCEVHGSKKLTNYK